MSIVGSGMYKIVHDTSYAESAALGRYIVCKVFDEKEQQVGQIKLEVPPHNPDATQPLQISLKTQGNLSHLDDQKVEIKHTAEEFHSLKWDHHGNETRTA